MNKIMNIIVSDPSLSESIINARHHFMSHRDINNFIQIINKVCKNVNLAGEKLTTSHGYPSFYMYVTYFCRRYHIEINFKEVYFENLNNNGIKYIIFEKFMLNLFQHKYAISNILNDSEIEIIENLISEGEYIFSEIYVRNATGLGLFWMTMKNIMINYIYDISSRPYNDLDDLIHRIKKYVVYISTNPVIRKKYEDNNKKKFILKLNDLIEKLNEFGFSYEESISHINSIMINSLMKE